MRRPVQTALALVMFDLDDFKMVNDADGQRLANAC